MKKNNFRHGLKRRPVSTSLNIKIKYLYQTAQYLTVKPTLSYFNPTKYCVGKTEKQTIQVFLFNDQVIFYNQLAYPK